MNWLSIIIYVFIAKIVRTRNVVCKHRMAQQETFANCLLSENCHEALVELGDGEIKVLEHVKSYITKYVSISEQYLQSMAKLNHSSAISRPDLKENSPFMQVSNI